MSFPDWGNVPAWIGAGSLLLAFRIFLRDRSRADRAQVDAVGVWWEIERDPLMPGMRRVDDTKVRMLVRNAGDLPVEATQIAWTIKTRWAVPDFGQALFPETDPHYPGVYTVQNGLDDSLRFTGPARIPPQKTLEGQWLTINLTHTAPDEVAWLDPTSEGLQCLIVYGLFTDNAGRRWETRHQKGKQARRIRWYSRTGPYYPAAWRNRIQRRSHIIKIRLSERIKRYRSGKAVDQ